MDKWSHHWLESCFLGTGAIEAHAEIPLPFSYRFGGHSLQQQLMPNMFLIEFCQRRLWRTALISVGSRRLSFPLFPPRLAVLLSAALVRCRQLRVLRTSLCVLESYLPSSCSTSQL